MLNKYKCKKAKGKKKEESFGFFKGESVIIYFQSSLALYTMEKLFPKLFLKYINICASLKRQDYLNAFGKKKNYQFLFEVTIKYKRFPSYNYPYSILILISLFSLLFIDIFVYLVNGQTLLSI